MYPRHVIADAGMIAPEGDVRAWCAALQALAANPALRAELGRKGRQRVLAHYTHASIARQTGDFFASLLSKETMHE